jgi:hypothetical protein
MIDATADRQGLTISATGTIRLRIHAKEMVQAKIAEREWELPGLRVSVVSDAKSFSLEKAGDNLDLVYTGMSQMKIAIIKVK